MKKYWLAATLILIGILIFLIVRMILAPEYLGNDNPVDGGTYSCFGYRYSKINKYYKNIRQTATIIHNYYCVGIPYDYNPYTKCFRLLFIPGFCNIRT